jgi:DNA-directed RNA polymerase sigma subunit (sigma70/sigma32)
MTSIYKERNLEMHRLRKEKAMTLTAIGKRYGVTRERVRVIVNKIEEQNANKDIQDIRTSGDGENNSPTE